MPPVPNPNEKQAARRALARIAAGIADPATRPAQGQVATFLNQIFGDVQNVPQTVQDDFHATFDDLTTAELQKFARMQSKMVTLHGQGYDTLAEVVNPTLAKF